MALPRLAAPGRTPRFRFLRSALLAAFAVLGALPAAKAADDPNWEKIAPTWSCPEWFKDAKYGLWLHWGPQSVPAKGGGWYARHMYQEDTKDDWGKEAWSFHRATYGHQSKFGYKDICNLWRAEKFDTEATVVRMKNWGARFVTTMGNHHDNFDLFPSSVHGWNSTRVGPKRDLVGEFAEAARKHHLPWGVSVHCGRAAEWMKPAFGSDKTGPMKDVPYDGNLTKADGAGKWWEGLDPQQLYASHYPLFEKEVTLRHLELIKNYRPDLLWLDERAIPAPLQPACAALYEQTRASDGSIQAVIAAKKPQSGIVLDYEKGASAEMAPDWWLTDTTLASDWFLKPDADGKSRLRHDARSLKELFVDIVSKRGVMMLNIAIRADGTIPDDQAEILDELGSWQAGLGEAIYGTRSWKIYGEGGPTIGGRFNERGISSKPWDSSVVRFTQDAARKILYTHVFGDPSGKTLTIGALAPTRGLFSGTISEVTVMGHAKPVSWSMHEDGLHVTLPEGMPFLHANAIRIATSGL